MVVGNLIHPITYILFNIYKDSSVGCKKGEGLLCREFPHKVIFLYYYLLNVIMNGLTCEHMTASTNCCFRIAGLSTRIWIVGSSIVKHAFCTARNRPVGVNLGLSRLGATVWLQGRSGLILSKMEGQINTMIRYEDQPDVIIINIGGNDIETILLGYLQYQLKQFLFWIWENFP